MTLPNAVQTRLSALGTRLDTCQRELDRLREAEKFERYEKVRDEEFIKIFTDICALVREAEVADAPYLVELAKAAGRLLDDGVAYSYGGDDDSGGFEEELYDYMPSWAHDDGGDRPLIKDENEGKISMSQAAVESFIRAFGSRLNAKDIDGLKTKPWCPSSKRHPKSTNMSRFRPNLPLLTLTVDKPVAASVLDARCEISSTRCSAPIGLHMSLGNTCLALAGMGGWKNRSAALDYFILDQPIAPSATFPALRSLQPRLSGIAYEATTDEARRLIFVGDNRRIKSYEWGSPSGIHDDPLHVHTLDTQRSQGPMIVLPNGSLVRAGKGGASVWGAQALSASNTTGGGTTEEAIAESDASDDEDWVDDDDDWGDDDDDDEEPGDFDRSPGLTLTSHINFLDQPNFKPNLWQPLPAAPSTVLCAEDSRGEGTYGCVGIDLETGKSTSHYLGHGGNTTAFSVSPTDPQLFLTGCYDGFSRLFDVRRPLPVVTFDACGQDESCEAVVLAYPNGIPIVFTGAVKGEQIKVWDVRARACVYELATGNNAVQSLAWDSQNNCLYAATECEYVDRLGFNHDYRYARIPKNYNPGTTEDIGGERCWPTKAWHKEDYFGYLFDAGGHRMIRYAFKEDPQLSVVPEYGSATAGGGYW